MSRCKKLIERLESISEKLDKVDPKNFIGKEIGIISSDKKDIKKGDIYKAFKRLGDVIIQRKDKDSSFSNHDGSKPTILKLDKEGQYVAKFIRKDRPEPMKVIFRVSESLSEADQYGIVLDILSNDEVSSDSEIVDLLSDETKFDKANLTKLVKAERNNFLKSKFKDDAVALKAIKKYI